jgi:diguanylate cyclase (GGDEF)-like protein
MVLLVVFVVDLKGLAGPIEAPWWAIALAFAAAEVFVVDVQFRRQAHSFSLTEIPLILGLFLAVPSALLIGRVVGAGIALVYPRRQSPLKFSFNMARFALETCIAIIVFHNLVSRGDPLGPWGWAAAFAATFLVDIVAAGMLQLVMSLSEKTSPRFPDVMELGSIGTVVNTTLALLGITAMWTHPGSAWMLFLLTAGSCLAFKAYASVRQKGESLELLNESTRVAHRAEDVHAVAASILTQAREMFRAEMAELLLFDAEYGPERAFRTLVAADDSVESTPSVDLDPTEGVWARVASEGQAILLTPPIESKRLRLYLEGRGIEDAMVAPLFGDGGITGTMMVANRLGDVGTFDEDDLKLFETLVNHAGVTMENFRLVERLRKNAAENQHQALHDALTGLPNRTLFHDRVRQALAASERDATKAAVMLMDLDRFKEINDTLGHHSGDLLLQEIGLRLQATIRESDTVARLGGDEFAILLPGVDVSTDVGLVAEKLIQALHRPFLIEDLALDVGASIGIATYPEHGMDANSLIQRADVAMYQSKDAHSDFEFYEPDRDEYSPVRLAMIGELRSAIDEASLSVFYQPKVRIADGAFVGVEALVRWDHPTRGFMGPDAFVPLAEHTGLIRPLTMFVIEQALLQCRVWEGEGRLVDVAVNLSARSLLDAKLPGDVARLLDKCGVDPRRLHLEITESTLMTDPVRTEAVLAKLSAMGISFAIDDFGTGYSSLSHLRRLPVAQIKIDKSFVMNLSSESDVAIVRSIIDLGRNLDLVVVAEGVDNVGVWAQLADWGCDVAQGYLIARPMPADRMSKWLASPGARGMLPPAITPLP